MSKMNVLLIAVDDLRPAINALGDARAITPNLDRLVASATGFTQCQCQHPICTASRASALTGCRPPTTRVHDLDTLVSEVRPDLPTLPGTFRAAGYETVTVGKVYHHKHDDPNGWSTFDPTKTPFPTNILPESVAINTAAMAARQAGRPARRAPSVECLDVADDAYSDPHIARAAISHLQRLRDQPFFVAAGFTKPHLPHTCPKRYWDLYDRDKLAAAVSSDPLIDPSQYTPHDFGELRQYMDIPTGGAPMPPEKRAELIHGYYACVSFLDAQIGMLLDALDSLGLRESTIVCLFADHGLMLGEYGLWCKHTLLDAACRVPLIIRDPRLSSHAGHNCDRIVELVDMFPTLCDLCDLDKPSTLEGRSLAPLMTDPTGAWDERAFNQYPRRNDEVWGRSIRTPRFRFTRWSDRTGQTPDEIELYDMTTGLESRNLASDPTHAETINRLSSQLDATALVPPLSE